MDIGFLTINEEGKITSFNKAAEKILGFKTKEVVGESYNKIFTNPGKDMGKTLVELKSEISMNMNASDKDGNPIPVMTTLFPLECEIAGKKRVFVTIKDMRERDMMEENLRQTDRLRSMGELVAGVVHEIRNPLAGISTNAQYIMENIKPRDKYYEEIQDILEDINCIDDIIKRMLSFARPQPPQKSKNQINDIIDETLKHVKIKLFKKNIKVRKEYGRGLPDIIVDPEQIKQVLFNIIINACQAMSSGGRLRIHAGVNKGGSSKIMEIVIEDTGCGIAKKDLDQIFNPFFTRNKEGTGLGLAISHRIIKEHRGDIIVESKKGEGTKVRICLPVV